MEWDHVPVTCWQMLSEVSPVRKAGPGHAQVQSIFSHCSSSTSACSHHVDTGLGSVPSLLTVGQLISIPLSLSMVSSRELLCALTAAGLGGAGWADGLYAKGYGQQYAFIIIHLGAGGGFSA